MSSMSKTQNKDQRKIRITRNLDVCYGMWAVRKPSHFPGEYTILTQTNATILSP